MGLVLARKPGQIIYIGEGENRVSITYHKKNKHNVWFEITAPDHIVIDRKEVAESKEIDDYKTREQLQEERDRKGNR